MRFFPIFILFALGCNLQTQAQEASLRGRILDTADKTVLHHSVVALLRADSVIIRFVRSDADGRFSLRSIPYGHFNLIITHPGYADFILPVQIKDTGTEELNDIPMILRSQLLQEVVVRQQLGAIRMKKDTLEFVADSFKVAANASVEDLIKRLPGLQVDKDGKITAQGEKVQKVLVDGEEFFGEDPTMATQNIRADAVDKVQVFDKKSDQAAFTGIDDGQRTKTINLKLKEDKKNGYFGKIILGGGLSDKYNNQAMFNSFKGKRKLAVFGVMSNTGRTGLGWADQNAYGGSSNTTIQMNEDNGGIMIMSQGDDFGGGGSFWGEGLPTSWSAGTHYSNKWNESKHNLNLNYRFNKLNTFGGGTTLSQFILPDTFYYRNESGNTFSQRLRNSLSGSYDIQLDSSSSIKITLSGNAGKTENENYSATESLNQNKNFVNQNQRNSRSSGDNQAFNSTVLWKKKFAKTGRTLSVNLESKNSLSTSDGYLNAANLYYDRTGTVNRKDTIDQEKVNNNKSSIFNSKISYTEPISKKTFLELNYGIDQTNSESERKSFDKVNGKYTGLIDSLSSDFSFDVLTHSGGANIRVNKAKFSYSFGGTISNAAFLQKDLVRDSSYRYQYLNFFPRGSFNWKIKPQTGITIRYNGSTKQPTIDQLQPLRDNNDPFNIKKGNPDLRQEFRHSFDLNFNDFKILNQRSVWGMFNFTTTTNSITNSDYTDTLGRRITQPVNINGNLNYYSYISYYFSSKKIGINISIDGNLKGNRMNTLVNGIKNTTNSANYTLGVNANYSKEKMMELNFGVERTYNTSKASINPRLNNNYWQTSVNSSVLFHLSKKLDVGSQIDFNFRQRTALFSTNRNVLLWNANLSQKFLKNDQGQLKFEVKDLLNQNIGFERNISSTNITQRTYDTLKRFWTLSFIWNFSKNGKAPTSPFE